MLGYQNDSVLGYRKKVRPDLPHLAVKVQIKLDVEGSPLVMVTVRAVRKFPAFEASSPV